MNGTTETTLRSLYAAFNRRDTAAALRLMTDQVDWPKASEGGRVVGKDAIREYWTRQWAEFDPQVEPVDIAPGDGGAAVVRVHQVVRSLTGEVLADSEVRHRYRLEDGLVARMDVEEQGAAEDGRSSAFARH